MLIAPRDFFARFESRPRKSLGQHFLTQPGTAERIVAAAGIAEADCVVEIGPGLGALTEFLIPSATVLHLIERDRDIAAFLRGTIAERGLEARVHLHEGDVLEFDFAALAASVGKRLVLVGNLPYNISSPIMFRLLEAFPAIGRGVFMVQKEVGERLAAPPGGKDYGVLSVLLGIHGSVRGLFTVGPGQFNPPPKVDSLVVRMDFAEAAPEGAPPFDFMRKVVSGVFQQRRKTLRNGLKPFIEGGSGDLDALFDRVDIRPERRPETLSVPEFLRLLKALRDILEEAK